MKLSPYDHCPFCVRADMVANYKQVEREKIYLSNDDEATCFELIGAKRCLFSSSTMAAAWVSVLIMPESWMSWAT
ncbi:MULTISPECIES: hypothetical protein [Pseudomonas]|nr:MULTISPECIES: hypothetical protein [Pseudomonas]ENA36453.1 hypothetical protein HMPREF1487_04610 [Pseudomonas sp. HPB0071]MCG7373625.1 hypothetical protein [Pseudomonas luteola]RRW41964.1 hypothetical protein EGJ50_21790 [Pseudomonas luteola]SHI29581.1 hypothetical protein SAMN05216295_10118 [Pseudomonas zeshuii]SPZ08157.1 Glutaredoxin-2 [Pseudomonas luteola]